MVSSDSVAGTGNISARQQEAEACLARGTALLQRGQAADAIACFKSVLAVGNDLRARINLSSALLAIGAASEAETQAEAATRQAPDDPLAWHMLGAAQMHLKRHAEAAGHFSRVLQLSPGFVPALRNHLCCLAWLADRDVLSVARTLGIAEASNTDILLVAAGILMEQSAQDTARELLFELAAAWPGEAEVWHALGIACSASDRLVEAIPALERALALQPGRADSLLALADCLCRRRNTAGATALIVRAEPLVDRDDVRLLRMLAWLYERVRRPERSAPVYRRILELRPDDAESSARHLDTALSACDWLHYPALLASVRRMLSEDAVVPVDVFNLQALPLPYEEIVKAARLRAETIARGVVRLPVVPARPRSERLRVGFALAYTTFHSLPMVLKEVVLRQNRDRLELFGYSNEPCDGSDFSRSYRAAFEHFRDLSGNDPDAAAHLVREDGIDVLIDTTGLTSHNCMALMARRPAPVQAHGFGYSITTGAPFIDYLLTDSIYLPPVQAAMGPEAPVYLQDCFMPALRPAASGATMSREEAGLSEDAIVFANFNHPCKFEPEIFGCWMRILKAVPGSVFWFGAWNESVRLDLSSAARDAGVSAERLLFAPIIPHAEHLARLCCADLALDTLHHGGGVTTVDALWAGLPLVTVRGATPSARLGATLSAAVGVTDLVVDDLQAYERLSVALAQDEARRLAISRRLLQARDTAPLFDVQRFAGNLDDACEAMWRRHESGAGPGPIDLVRER